MSLKAIAEEALARLRSGETGHETKKETEMKQVKQGADPCFTGGSVCFMPVKHDSRRKTTENGPCFTVSFPRGETHETRLPEHLAAALQRLRSRSAPRGVNPAAWSEVVADAARLARDGWAAQALALGWSDLDLFGAVADAEGDPSADGLAVKLGGRRVLAMCETFATIAGPDGGRCWHYRGNNEGAVLLWELGHGAG